MRKAGTRVRVAVQLIKTDDGKQIWSQETGTPSGQGVASDNIYYLPLKETTRSKEPAICLIDVEKGQVNAQTKSRKKEVPGNLLFFDGAVISQTPTEVVAYPQLKVKMEEGWGPREIFANGAINGGGAILKLNTSTGSIQIKRK